VLAALPLAARSYLETLMTTQAHEYQSDFARRYFFQGRAEGEAKGEAKGRTEGRAEGKAGAVLGFLDARGVDISADARTRITECGDLDQLDIWIRRAVTADSIHDLFTG
ncbi:MAG: hypothetical protein ACRDSR_24660, partial [Pseudonocardiaceae bacterium]